MPAEVKKSVNIAANLLWDNPEYVFGWPRPGLTEKQAREAAGREPSPSAGVIDSHESEPARTESDGWCLASSKSAGTP